MGRSIMHLVAVLTLLIPGCGARTDPVLGTESEAKLEQEDGAAGVGQGVCRICTTQVPECSYCVLQGAEAWVCPAGKGAPSSGCTNLQELYTRNGVKFTCYYC